LRPFLATSGRSRFPFTIPHPFCSRATFSSTSPSPRGSLFLKYLFMARAHTNPFLLICGLLSVAGTAPVNLHLPPIFLTGPAVVSFRLEGFWFWTARLFHSAPQVILFPLPILVYFAILLTSTFLLWADPFLFSQCCSSTFFCLFNPLFFSSPNHWSFSFFSEVQHIRDASGSQVFVLLVLPTPFSLILFSVALLCPPDVSPSFGRLDFYEIFLTTPHPHSVCFNHAQSSCLSFSGSVPFGCTFHPRPLLAMFKDFWCRPLCQFFV